MPNTYIPRVVDQELAERLRSAGAVVLEGPKACGKTETARRAANSEVLLDVDASAREAVSIDPSLVLEGSTPRLIDEWQVAPEIWNHIRRLVDDRKTPGQFVLTGSSVPSEDHSRHTGAGRFSFVRMRPLSLFESGYTTGRISLKALMSGSIPRSPDPNLTVADLAARVTVGGWPAQQGRTVRDASRAVRDYLKQIAEVDVGRAAGGRRDERKVSALIRSLARNVSTEVATSVLAADAGGSDNPLSRDVVIDYLALLDRLMVIEDQPAWAPHMRSRAVLRRSPKRHFVDPSLAAAAMGVGPEQMLRDLNSFGFLFESLVVRDLRILSQPLGGRVFHYRDNKGGEVDAVVAFDDGRWAAFEIKLSVARVDEGAASLLRLADALDLDRCGLPASLAVITGSGLGYKREDGIAVIPIGALAP